MTLAIFGYLNLPGELVGWIQKVTNAFLKIGWSHPLRQAVGHSLLKKLNLDPGNPWCTSKEA